MRSCLTQAILCKITQLGSTICPRFFLVSLEIGKKTGRNEHGSVYGQLYWRFEATNYKQLPAERFQEALDRLTDGY
jgi:hypothetical protein